MIGELWVSVRPETSGFEKDLEAKLQGVGASAGGGIQGALSKLGAGVAVGLVAAGAGAVALGIKFQAVTAQIAASADISTAAADKIGKAFLTTVGTTTFSAIQIGEAYAGVAGQLGLVAGHALNAKQALDFMKVSTDLAEASGTDLTSTTHDLATVMQTFQIPLKGAAGASNDLFNTSRVLGVGIDALSSTIDRLKSRLGVAAPSLTDMSALLVDLGAHGISGSRGLLVVNTALTTLLGTATKVPAAVGKTVDAATTAVTTSATALTAAQTKLAQTQSAIGAAAVPSLANQQALANATNAVTDAQQKLAASTSPTLAQQQALTTAQLKLTEVNQKIAAQGTLTASQQTQLQNAEAGVTAATTKHTAAVQTLTTAQAGLSPSLSTAITGAEQLGLQVFNASGKFVGMGQIIAELQPKLKGLTEEQQLNALSSVFGASASKALLDTVLAGPKAYDSAVAAVTKHNAVQDAAKLKMETLAGQMKVLKATLTDLGTSLGTALVPALDKLVKIGTSVVEFFVHTKAAAIALGAVVGGIAVVSLGAFALTLKDKLGDALFRVSGGLISFGEKARAATGNASEAIADSAGVFHDASGKIISATDAVNAGLQDQATHATTLGSKLTDLGATFGGLTDKVAPVDDSLSGLSGTQKEVQSATDQVAASTDRLATAFAAMDDVTASVQRSTGELGATLDSAGAGFEMLAGNVEASGISLDDLMAIQKAVDDSTAGLGTTLGAAGESFDALAVATDSTDAAMARVVESQRSVETSSSALGESSNILARTFAALDDIAATLRTGFGAVVTALSGVRDAFSATGDAVGSVDDAMSTATATVGEASAAYSTAASRWGAASGEFVTASDAMGAGIDAQATAADGLDTQLATLTGSLGVLAERTAPVSVALDDLVGTERLAASSADALAGSSEALVAAFAAVDEAQGTVAAGFAEIDAALAGTGAGFDALAATVEAGDVAMGEAGEAAGIAVDSAFGPIGIALVGLTLLLPLVLKHWKEIWDGIKAATVDAWHAIETALHFIEAGFDDALHFVEGHWKILAAILIAPLAPVIIAFAPLIAAVAAIGVAADLLVTHWKTVWSGIEDVAEDVWHFLDRVFDEIKDVVTKHLTEIGIAAAVLLGPFALIIAGVVELAVHWKEVWKVIGDVVTDVVAVVKSTLSDLGSFFSGIASAAIAPFKAAWDGFSKWWSAYWPEFDQVLTGAFDAIKDVFGAFVDIASAEWDVLEAVFKTAFAVIADVVTAGWDAISAVFKGAFDAIAAVVKIGIDAIETVIRVLWPLISGIFRADLDIVIGVVRAAFTIIETVFKVAFGAVSAVVRSVWDVISGEIKAAMDLIKGIIEVALDLLTGHWSKAWHDLTHTVEAVAGDILGAVRSVFANLLGFIAGSIGTILEAMKKVGQSLIGGLVSGLSTAWGAVVGFVTGIPGKLEAFFVDAGKWLLDAGKSLIEGLIKGAVEAPLHGIEAVGKHILGAFKSVLHIFSPSDLTAEMGHQLIAGLEKGINEEAADTSKFTKAIASIIPAMQKLIGDLTKVLTAGLAGGATAVGPFAAGVVKGLDAGLAPATAHVRAFSDTLVKGLSDPLTKTTAAVGSFAASFAKALDAVGVAIRTVGVGTTPLVNAIAGVVKAIRDAGTTKLSATFTHDLEYLATLATRLQPAPLIASLAAIKSAFASLTGVGLAPALAKDDVGLATFTTAAKATEGSVKELASVVVKAAADMSTAAADTGKIATAFDRANEEGGKISATFAKIVDSASTTAKAIQAAGKVMGPDLFAALLFDKAAAKLLGDAFTAIAERVETGSKKVKATVGDWTAFGKALSDVLKPAVDLGTDTAKISDGLVKGATGGKALAVAVLEAAKGQFELALTTVALTRDLVAAGPAATAWAASMRTLSSIVKPIEAAMKALGTAVAGTAHDFGATTKETDKIARSLTQAESAGAKLIVNLGRIGDALRNSGAVAVSAAKVMGPDLFAALLFDEAVSKLLGQAFAVLATNIETGSKKVKATVADWAGFGKAIDAAGIQVKGVEAEVGKLAPVFAAADAAAAKLGEAHKATETALVSARTATAALAEAFTAKASPALQRHEEAARRVAPALAQAGAAAVLAAQQAVGGIAGWAGLAKAHDTAHDHAVRLPDVFLRVGTAARESGAGLVESTHQLLELARVSTVAQAAANALAVAVEKISRSLTAIGSFAPAFKADLEDPFTRVIASVNAFASALASGFVKPIEDARTRLASITPAVLDAVRSFKAADAEAVAFGPDFTERITGSFTAVVTAAESFAPRFAKAIATVGPSVGGVSTALGVVAREVTGCLDSLVACAVTVGKAIPAALAVGISAGAGTVKTAVSGIPGALAVIGTATDKAVTAARSLDDALTPAGARIKSFGAEMVKDLQDPLTASVAALTSFGTSFLKGFGVLTEALTLVKGFGPAVVTAIDGALKSVGATVATFTPGFVRSFLDLDKALAAVQRFGVVLVKSVQEPLTRSLAVVRSFGAELLADIEASLTRSLGAVGTFAAGFVKALDSLAATGKASAAGIKPVADAIAQLTAALREAATAKLPKGFTDDVAALVDAADRLRPGPITAAIAALRSGFAELTGVDLGPSLVRDDTALKVFTATLTPAMTAVSGLATRVAAVATEMARAATGSDIATSALSAAGKAVGTVDAAFAVMVSTVSRSTVAIREAGKAMGPELLALLTSSQGAAGLLARTFDAVASAASTFGARFGAAIATIGPSVAVVKTAVADLAASVSTRLATLEVDALVAGRAITEAMAKGLTAGAAAVGDALAKVSSGFGVFEAAIGRASDSTRTFDVSLIPVSARIKAFGAGLLADIQAPLSAALAAVSTFGAGFARALDALTATVRTVTTGIAPLVGEVDRLVTAMREAATTRLPKGFVEDVDALAAATGTVRVAPLIAAVASLRAGFASLTGVGLGPSLRADDDALVTLSASLAPAGAALRAFTTDLAATARQLSSVALGTLTASTAFSTTAATGARIQAVFAGMVATVQGTAEAVRAAARVLGPDLLAALGPDEAAAKLLAGCFDLIASHVTAAAGQVKATLAEWSTFAKGLGDAAVPTGTFAAAVRPLSVVFTALGTAVDTLTPRLARFSTALVTTATTVGTAFASVASEVTACLAKLEASALAAGTALMAALAKGITEGTSLVKAAVDRISLTLAVPAARAPGIAPPVAHPATHPEGKHELLAVELLSDSRLAQLVTASASGHALGTAKLATLTSGFARLTTLGATTVAAIRTLGTGLATLAAPRRTAEPAHSDVLTLKRQQLDQAKLAAERLGLIHGTQTALIGVGEAGRAVGSLAAARLGQLVTGSSASFALGTAKLNALTTGFARLATLGTETVAAVRSVAAELLTSRTARRGAEAPHPADTTLRKQALDFARISAERLGLIHGAQAAMVNVAEAKRATLTAIDAKLATIVASDTACHALGQAKLAALNSGFARLVTLGTATVAAVKALGTELVAAIGPRRATEPPHPVTVGLKKELLDQATLTSERMALLVSLGAAKEGLMNQSLTVERSGFTDMVALTRATATTLDNLVQRDFAAMTASLLTLEGGIRFLDSDLRQRLVTENTLLLNTLNIDRLAYAESQTHTGLLRQLLQQAKNPQPQKITLQQPLTGNANGSSTTQLASGVLT